MGFYDFMREFSIVCPCAFGLESVLAFEIKKIGGENIVVDNGRVTFEGHQEHIVLANVGLRTAERVLILLSKFHADTFEDLFESVKCIDFAKYLDLDSSFPVKGWSINSVLQSVPSCQSIIKKAIVENLKEHYNVDWFEETGEKHSIHFSIYKDLVSIMLDTSGDSLYKRGYRRFAVEAPIRETLAAGMVDLAHVKSDTLVYDPMCGSGTILIEAAMKAFNIAPGLNRNFLFEGFKFIDKSILPKVKSDFKSKINMDLPFKAFGFDICDDAIKISRMNIESLGLSNKIKVFKKSIYEFAPKVKDACIITNPPYGDRIYDKTQAKHIYKTLGHLSRNYKDLKFYVISPEEEFERFFGKNSKKRRKLYNGMIKCQFHMYF